jgi:hypothetical protein
LEQLVVLEVPADGLERAVARCGRVPVRRAEQVVLQLRGGHRGQPGRSCGVDLAAEDRPGRDGCELLGAGVVDVAEDERRAVEPVGPAERGEVGAQQEVAVAEVPAGEPVARHRFELHVGGQQVVAGMGAVAGHLVEEELTVDALARQPAVVVGEADDHRVDGAARHLGPQLVEGQHVSSGWPAGRPSCRPSRPG